MHRDQLLTGFERSGGTGHSLIKTHSCDLRSDLRTEELAVKSYVLHVITHVVGRLVLTTLW